VTFTLIRWSSYTNSTRSLGRYTSCANMNFLHQGFRKLSSDRHRPLHIHTYIYRQTDTTKTIRSTYAASLVVKLPVNAQWLPKYWFYIKSGSLNPMAVSEFLWEAGNIAVCTCACTVLKFGQNSRERRDFLWVNNTNLPILHHPSYCRLLVKFLLSTEGTSI